MRNSILRASALAAILAATGGFARGQGIQVTVNGDPVAFDTTGPREVDGRVMVPLRGVLEKLGAFVDWDAGTRTVTASKTGTDIRLPIGSRTAYVNDRPVPLDVPAMIMQGSTMVPLRFVSESLGADVAWNGTTRTVRIAMNSIPANEEFRPGRAHVGRDDYQTPSPNYDDTVRSRIYDDQNRQRAIDEQNRQRLLDEQNRRTASSVQHVTLSSGTVVRVRLDDRLSSRDNQRGDRVSATVVPGRDDAGLPAATRFEGVIRDIAAAAEGKPGIIDVDWNRVIFPDNASRSITATLYSLDNKSVRRNSEGYLTASSDKGKDRLTFIGIGAGAGLVIGALTKSNELTMTLLGAGLGYLYNELKGQKPSDVNLRSGTEFGIRMDRDFTFNRR